MIPGITLVGRRCTVHRRATILTSTAVLALLAGCGGTPAADQGGPAAAQSGPAASKAPAKVGLADCLVGSWTLDNSSAVAMLKSLSGSATASEVTYTGTATTTFAKGGTFTTQDNLTTVTKTTTEGQTTDLLSTATGEQKGTWQVDGGTLTPTVTEDGVKPKISVKVNGKDMAAPKGDAGVSDGVLPKVPVAATCDDTTLTLTIDFAAAATAAGQTWPASMPAQLAVAYKRA
jgi:hypothetical protein